MYGPKIEQKDSKIVYFLNGYLQKLNDLIK